MNSVRAVFGRELRSASRQPVVWFVAGAFLALHGIFFTQLMEEYSQTSVNILAGTLSTQDFTLPGAGRLEVAVKDEGFTFRGHGFRGGPASRAGVDRIDHYRPPDTTGRPQPAAREGPPPDESTPPPAWGKLPGKG